MRDRSPIRYRNAITELWNGGCSTMEIAYRQGLSEDRVRACLKAARAGYNTPEDMTRTETAKAEAKAARKGK